MTGASAATAPDEGPPGSFQQLTITIETASSGRRNLTRVVTVAAGDVHDDAARFTMAAHQAGIA